MSLNPDSLYSARLLENHMPDIDTDGNLVGCTGCGWKNEHNQYQWFYYLLHLPPVNKVDDKTSEVLSVSDMKFLKELAIRLDDEPTADTHVDG